jgi:hypothetical protein
MCMLCRSWFVYLYFFFWSLYCLFFFDLRILTTPLISLSSSYSRNTSFTLILIFTFLLVNLVIFYNLYFRVWRNGVAIYTSEHNGFLVSWCGKLYCIANVKGRKLVFKNKTPYIGKAYGTEYRWSFIHIIQSRTCLLIVLLWLTYLALLYTVWLMNDSY